MHEKNFKVLAARQVDLVKVKGKIITKPKLRPCGVVWRKNMSPTSSSRGVKIDTEEGLAAARNGQDIGRPRTELLSAPSHMNAKTWRQGKKIHGCWIIELGCTQERNHDTKICRAKVSI
jgi:hypothetical protein